MEKVLTIEALLASLVLALKNLVSRSNTHSEISFQPVNENF